MNKEIWKGICGYEELYQVSNMGRVRSLDRTIHYFKKDIGKTKRLAKGKIKVPTKQNGYFVVGLSKASKGKLFYVHRLVLQTFFGEGPKDHQCRHLDGNCLNNSLENLMWGTPKENGLDKIQHGTVLRGEGITNSKLTEKDVLKIRKFAKAGKKAHQISKIFKIGKSTAYQILNRKTWRHI